MFVGGIDMKMLIGRTKDRSVRPFTVIFSFLLVTFFVISCATAPQPSTHAIPTLYQRVVETEYQQVIINSEPKGAKVYINQLYKGETPLTVSLPYKIAEAGLSIEGDLIQVQKFPLGEEYFLYIYKDGYEVWKDYIGWVPLDTVKYSLYKKDSEVWIRDLPKGYYEVKHASNMITIGIGNMLNIYYRGEYNAIPKEYWNKLVFLKPIPFKMPSGQQQQQQQQQQIIIEKSKELSYLSVTSDPSEAEVYLDDNLIGITPVTNVKLKPGNYRLKVVKGNKGWEKNILLPEEGSLQIKADLR